MARTCILRTSGLEMSFCLSLVLRLFVLFRFCLYDFIEAAALRSIVLRYACAPTATRSYLTTVYVLFLVFVSFVFVFPGDVAFSECILYHYRFLFCVESTWYVMLIHPRQREGQESWKNIMHRAYCINSVVVVVFSH